MPRPDLSIVIFDSGSGKPWAELRGGHVNLRFDTKAMGGLQFNFDGSRLASASWDCTVCVWDVVNKKRLYNITELFGTGRVSFSPDGRFLASGGPNHAHRAVFWDAGTGKQADPHVQHYSTLRSLTFSPDGQRVATVSGTRDDPWIHLWETKTGKPLRSLHGHPGGCSDAKFSPDGKKLATGGKDRTVKIWDLASGEPLHVLRGEHSWVTYLAFSPDGKWLASGDNFVSQGQYFGKTCVWDVRKGELVTLLQGQSGAIDSLAFTSDGKKLVTGANGIRVWKAATWRAERDFATAGSRVWALALSRDGRFLFTGHDGPPQLWEWETGQLIASLPADSGGVGCDISADGRMVAITSFGKLRLWHWPSQKVIWERSQVQHPVAFSPCGDWITTGEADVAAALVWRLPAEARAPLEKIDYEAKRFLQAWSELAAPADRAYPALWQCVRMGDAILPALKKQWPKEAEEGPFIRQALAKPSSLEQARRLQELLKSAKEMDVVQRQRRAVLLLEQIGTPSAVQMLAELGAGEIDPELRADIQSTLLRLKQRK